MKEKLENLCGLFLRKGEKEKLQELCVKFNIPIKYPKLFIDDKHYYFWGIRKTGVGLVSIVIMNYLKDNNGVVFNSVSELENYLKNNKL